MDIDAFNRLRDPFKVTPQDAAKAADEIEWLREALDMVACLCEKPCDRYIEKDGQKIPMQCTGWIARAALKETE